MPIGWRSLVSGCLRLFPDLYGRLALGRLAGVAEGFLYPALGDVVFPV
jgi:hypothetical protein